MVDVEELAARLNQISDDYYGERQLAKENAFMDKYGSRFSNNRSMGMAILNELDRRGVDTSAADEAVTEILDRLSNEIAELSDILGMAQKTLNQQADKVDTISEVVSEQLAQDADASIDRVDTDAIVPEEPAPDAVSGMSPDAEFVPDVPAEPVPAEEPVEPMPAEEPAEPAPAEEPMPAEDVVPSDKRIKQIKGVLSDVRMKKVKATQSTCFKPSAGMIEAAQRGY